MEPPGCESRGLAAREGAHVEPQVVGRMPAPVAAVVPAGRDVQLHLLAVVAQNARERPGRLEKRIGVACIEPDRSAAERLAAASSREHVVAPKILCVVKRAGGRLAAGAPESRRVAADRAESGPD
jgi:hypothetical protein